MQTHLIILAVLAATIRAIPFQGNHYIIDDRQLQNPAALSSTVKHTAMIKRTPNDPDNSDLAKLQNTFEERFEGEPGFGDSVLGRLVEERIREEKLPDEVVEGAEEAAKRL
jgi:hypothetical protein